MSPHEIQKYFDKQRQHLTKEEYRVIRRALERLAEREDRSNAELAETLKNKGNEEFKNKDYEAALESYRQAIIYNPENAVYHSNLAAALAKLDREKEAIECCERGLEIDSSFVKLYVRLGNLYRKSDRAKAMEVVGRGLGIDPTSTALARLKEELESETDDVAKSESDKLQDMLGRMNVGGKSTPLDLQSLFSNDKSVVDSMEQAMKGKSPEEIAAMVQDAMRELGHLFQ
jgi:small glutamine-rich tetratricopeptide repeat-containing protein alpha